LFSYFGKGNQQLNLNWKIEFEQRKTEFAGSTIELYVGAVQFDQHTPGFEYLIIWFTVLKFNFGMYN